MGRTVYYEGKTIDECYQEELKEIEQWRDGEYAKIQKSYDEMYELSKNPMSSSAAQSVMNSGAYSYNSGTASSGGNIDSFAAANAMRNQQAMNNAKYDMALKAANQQIAGMQSEIDGLKVAIEGTYKSKVNEALNKWHNMEKQLVNDYPLNILTN